MISAREPAGTFVPEFPIWGIWLIKLLYEGARRHVGSICESLEGFVEKELGSIRIDLSCRITGTSDIDGRELHRGITKLQGKPADYYSQGRFRAVGQRDPLPRRIAAHGREDQEGAGRVEGACRRDKGVQPGRLWGFPVDHGNAVAGTASI